MDYGDNVNGGVKLNLSFESSQMTSRLCQFIMLPPSGFQESKFKLFPWKSVYTSKDKVAYKLPPKM